MISSRVVTKIVQPSRSRLLLHRSRLVDFLHQQVHRKLVLLSASAGYGKTSLLIDFAHETALPVCWYSLDASDSDPQVFLDYLVAAVNRRFPSVGEKARLILEGCRCITADLGSTPSALDAVVGILVTEMHENITDPFVIILDDYHTVAESDAVNHLVETLLTYLPEKAHLVISSRSKPEKLNLHRLAARNEIAGLGIQDLQFTADEIHALIEQNHQVDLSEQQTRELAVRSEGWIAGILLTTPMLWQGLYQRLLQRATTNNEEVYRFLASEAFAFIDSERQRFLLDCAVLFRMDAITCNEFLGISNAAELLRTFEDQNLFIVQLDGESSEPTYRFHNLYHEFLRQRLREIDPTHWRDLNRRAGELYEKTDSFKAQAIAHYLAAAMPNEAARVMEAIAQSAFDAGQWTTLGEWIDALPTEVLQVHPDLLVMRGMVCAETGKNAESQAAYAQAIEIYERKKDALAAAKVILRRAMLWRQMGRYREAIEACQGVLTILHRRNARWEEARAYRTIGVACAYLAEYPCCVTQQEKALKLYQELGDELRVAWLHHDIGVSFRIHGDPRAEEHFQRALAYWDKTHNLVGLSTTLNSVGVGHHQAGNYVQAIGVLEEARALSHQIVHRRNEAYALASLGDVYRDQGDYTRARELYHQVLEIAEGLDGFILTYALIALGEVHHLLDDPNAGQAYLARALETARLHGSNYEIGLAETAIGISLSAIGSVNDAIIHLNRAVKLLTTMKRDRIRARLHLAQAHFLQRNYDQVHSQLEAIAEQNPAHAAIAIPFICADQKQLRPLIAYAVSKRLSDNYYAPVLEKFRGKETVREHTPRTPRLVLYVHALGNAQVYVGVEKDCIVDWKTESVKELFFLILANPEGLRTEEIVERLWGDNGGADPTNNFHTVKARLRKIIPDCVEKDHGVYILSQGIELRYDVAEFETWIQSARQASTDAECLKAYERAIPLYQGDYFEDCYNDWCEGSRERLRKMYLDALFASAEIKEHQGDLKGARDIYQQYLQKDRDREEIYRALMRLHAKLGDRGSAVKSYQQCIQVLQNDLDISEPSPETVELYTQITKGEIELAPAE